MAGKKEVYTSKVTDPRSVEDALRKVIKAWEELPPGAYTGHSGAFEVNNWLKNEMTPAIHAARSVLGLPNVPIEKQELQFRG